MQVKTSQGTSRLGKSLLSLLFYFSVLFALFLFVENRDCLHICLLYYFVAIKFLNCLKSVRWLCLIVDQSCPVHRRVRKWRADFERDLRAPTKRKRDFIHYINLEFSVLKQGTSRHNVSSYILLFALLELLYLLLLLFSSH